MFSHIHSLCSSYSSHSLLFLSDQIDENLKLTLQEDLTSMAPGLIIQVQCHNIVKQGPLLYVGHMGAITSHQCVRLYVLNEQLCIQLKAVGRAAVALR